jgi:hypothetical protein
MERPTVDLAVNLVDHLHDIHSYAHQLLKLVRDRMKARCDRLVNCTGYHEGSKVWLCCPTYMKGKLTKLQSPWEGPFKVVTQLNDMYTGSIGTVD